MAHLRRKIKQKQKTFSDITEKTSSLTQKIHLQIISLALFLRRSTHTTKTKRTKWSDKKQ
jgi:hypothetical protein